MYKCVCVCVRVCVCVCARARARMRAYVRVYFLFERVSFCALPRSLVGWHLRACVGVRVHVGMFYSGHDEGFLLWPRMDWPGPGWGA